MREGSGVAYHHDGCDVIWFGMEWLVLWYSGMTPIIDWYAITTTVLLLLVVEHETGRATVASYGGGPEARTKQGKQAGKHHRDSQPNRHRHLEQTPTTGDGDANSKPNPTGRMSQCSNGRDIF